jgi:hypothetical protein
MGRITELDRVLQSGAMRPYAHRQELAFVISVSALIDVLKQEAR